MSHPSGALAALEKCSGAELALAIQGRLLSPGSVHGKKVSASSPAGEHVACKSLDLCSEQGQGRWAVPAGASRAWCA